jgi:Glycosyl transferase family 2
MNTTTEVEAGLVSVIGGLTSIIIPCWNQCEFTKQCIRALMRHTRPPWELIVVDNGSTDETSAYLAGVQDGEALPVTVIANATNRGFPAAINQGPQVARGDYLVLLENYVVVTDASLDQLIALATAKTGSDAGSTASEAPCPAAQGPPHPGPPFARAGKCAPSEDVGSIMADRVSTSAWSDRCRTTLLRRSWLKTCRIETSPKCTALLAAGATSTAASGAQAVGVLPAHEARAVRRDRWAR